MKRFLSLILALVILVSVAACGKAPQDEVETDAPVIEEQENAGDVQEELPGEDAEAPVEEETPVEEEEASDLNKPAEKPEQTPSTSTPAEKPEQTPSTSTPAAKPQQTPSTSTPAAKPQQTPSTSAPAAKPQQTPSQKPEETTPEQSKGSPAKTLLSDFKNRVSGGTTDPEALASALISNPIIPFMGASVPVEPGYLNGFREEITGFAKGAMFGPTIGTIAFVGYIFEVDANTDVNTFIKTLKDNADLRWNICTSADEMAVDAVGKTVFFVMAPAQFEE